MKRVAITQSNYIPWKGYFDFINSVDCFVVYDDVQYTRRDWRNRNRIKTKSGLQWLTIPVQVKGNYDQKICDVKVADPQWAERHWKTIRTNYLRTTYFPKLESEFERSYLQASKLSLLSDINLLFLRKICDLLGISTTFVSSSLFAVGAGRTERLVHICKQLQATEYFSGPTAKNYLDESLFSQEGIHVHYFDYTGYPQYHQFHGEFVHEVSILDLLFHAGDQAVQYMKSFNR
jgi:WbqC-like protein family